MRTSFFAVLLLLLTACATTPDDDGPLQPAPPWRQEPIPGGAAPAVYTQEWLQAENRATCALIAPRSLGPEGAGATPRAATFSGGWAVAYDLPNLRSAFGVAGTGAKADAPGSYDQWPHAIQWDDGSKAEYGPEGGQGPKQLAYVRIQGQECLYNVWSAIGREHLELLLRELRFVR
ncbi:MAG TPA: hypothetical protein VEO54_05465 [Thermoanaerobaculia bacterium]|nr:hypothetical protein [Thermoanaerobaculia bacterium]